MGVVEMTDRQAVGQVRLRCSFNLEDHVPQSHLPCGIDRCVDRGGRHDPLAANCRRGGHPFVDAGRMPSLPIEGAAGTVFERTR